MLLLLARRRATRHRSTKAQEHGGQARELEVIPSHALMALSDVQKRVRLSRLGAITGPSGHNAQQQLREFARAGRQRGRGGVAHGRSVEEGEEGLPVRRRGACQGASGCTN